MTRRRLLRLNRLARSALGAVAAIALFLTVLTVWPASARQPSPGSPPPAAATATLSRITLITGDEVRVRGGRVAGVRMAETRRHLRYWQYRVEGHDYVVPEDAVPLLASGRLDERLFDITGLLEQGLDDAHEPAVPVIIETEPGRTARVPAASEHTVTMTKLGLTAVGTPKRRADTGWRQLKHQLNARASTAGGIRKVWLNGRIRPLLDESVPQVGAPDAWRAGLRGDGVPVAVLDTGYDAGHPDLANTVDKAKDFTGGGAPATDPHGHGTHVASTIAGSGAASDGRYTGVAPGARLLIGKVIGDSGYGQDAWLLAGMQWAVDQGAKVVNMSLGGGVTDGTDLVSRKLNELSKTSGTLFVVAAGNAGQRGMITAPGSADRALTVGSVTKSDELSVFSSRGPRAGDYGLKPEITAPGSEIIAARAEGTLVHDSVDERYATLSGTSMATPHVAGAAAILAQQHPQWTDEQLKSTLVGSAKRLAGIDTFGQGSGRLDISRAVGQGVRVRGVLGFGEVWTDTERRVSRTVHYVNDGERPVRLALWLDVRDRNGRHARPGLFTLDKRATTVPPGSSVPVTVTAHVSDVPRGEFSGVLRARGSASLVTPLTARLPGSQHTLTVHTIARAEGQQPLSQVILQNERTGSAQVAFAEDGTAEFTVPSGRYRVLGRIKEGDEAGEFADTMFAKPLAAVTSDTEVVVDAGQGKRIFASLNDPEARSEFGGGHAVLSDPDESGPMPGAAVIRANDLSRFFPLYTVGAPRMSGLSFNHYSYWTRPVADVTLAGPGGFTFEDTYVSDRLGFTGKISGELVDVGYADRESIDNAGDVRGKIALIAPPDWSNPHYPDGKQLRDGVKLLAERGATLVLSHFNPDWQGAGEAPALPTVMVFMPFEVEEAQRLIAERRVQATVVARDNSPVAYFLADRVPGLPAGHHFRFDRNALGAVEREFVDTREEGAYRYTIASWSAHGLTAGADVELFWPHRRTDYVTPGASFSLLAAGGFDPSSEWYSDFAWETSIPVTLRAGERRTSRMFGAPFGPELTEAPASAQDGEPVPWAYRQGDKLTLAIPMFADSDPSNASQFDLTNHGSTVLLNEDGEVLAKRDDRPALGTFTVPRGPGRFRLIASAERPLSKLLTPPLATSTSAEWTFRAETGAADRVALPLLDVRFDLPLDAHNRAGAADPVVGSVAVAHQPGARSAPVRTLRVEVSYDEGATWQPVEVDRHGARWAVRIPGDGAPGEFASLRATARDVAGNSVTETVIRAYALR